MSRSTYKNYIITQLQTISFEGVNLTVTDHYLSNALTDPYLWVQSGELAISLLDNRNYKMDYSFLITMAFDVKHDLDDPMQEVRIDTLEELVIAKLQTEAVRNNSLDSSWLDLQVTGVSSIFEPEGSITNNRIYKSISVEVFSVKAMT